jgi:periplasmic divalent cation tolerance protein
MDRVTNRTSIARVQSIRIVLVTAPDRATARRLTRLILDARAAACVNLIPGIESHYWWEGRVESAKEVLMVLKTTPGRIARLERLVREQHPYDTPEFLVLPITSTARRYLEWVQATVR